MPLLALRFSETVATDFDLETELATDELPRLELAVILEGDSPSLDLDAGLTDRAELALATEASELGLIGIGVALALLTELDNDDTSLALPVDPALILLALLATEDTSLALPVDPPLILIALLATEDTSLALPVDPALNLAADRGGSLLLAELDLSLLAD